MTCRETRDRLVRDAPASGPAAAGVTEHLRACAACARFAELRESARDGLRAHHAGVEPDAYFAARVLARLERPEDALGWAALRLLPAALALAVLLGALHEWRLTHPASGLPAPTESAETADGATADDPLLWVADLQGGES